jgi:cellulose synthase/poly-beta-1,6-N-acetylglucosamine synthase-like glycosyltransferase
MIGFIALFGLAAWIYLLLFHYCFWHADQRFLVHENLLPAWPSVVAVVPARNESETTGAVTVALLAQDYADGTADIARATSCQAWS